VTDGAVNMGEHWKSLKTNPRRLWQQHAL